jgi:hypothetical protein
MSNPINTRFIDTPEEYEDPVYWGKGTPSWGVGLVEHDANLGKSGLFYNISRHPFEDGSRLVVAERANEFLGCCHYTPLKDYLRINVIGVMYDHQNASAFYRLIRHVIEHEPAETAKFAVADRNTAMVSIAKKLGCEDIFHCRVFAHGEPLSFYSASRQQVLARLERITRWFNEKHSNHT